MSLVVVISRPFPTTKFPVGYPPFLFFLFFPPPFLSRRPVQAKATEGKQTPSQQVAYCASARERDWCKKNSSSGFILIDFPFSYRQVIHFLVCFNKSTRIQRGKFFVFQKCCSMILCFGVWEISLVGSVAIEWNFLHERQIFDPSLLFYYHLIRSVTHADLFIHFSPSHFENPIWW